MATRAFLPHLTGIRAIAAYSLLFGHFFDARFNVAGVSLFHPFAAVFAYFGMTLFFVLSGFIITYSYDRIFRDYSWKKAVMMFASARFARLYPLYLFALLLQIKYTLPAFSSASYAEIFSYVTLTQSWFNFQHLTFANAWSISAECFFYLMFALFMGVTIKLMGSRRLSFSALIWISWLFVVLFLIFMYGLFTQRDFLDDVLRPYVDHRYQHLVWGWLVYLAPYLRLGEFAIGALAARLLMSTRDDDPISPTHFKRSLWLCWGCIVMIVLLGIYHVTHYGYDTYLFILTNNFAVAPFYAYLLYAMCRYPNVFTRFLSHRWIVAAGEISYSLYIMQFIIFFWPLKHLFPYPSSFTLTPQDWIVTTISIFFYMGVVTLVSIATYRYIETPSRYFLRFGLKRA